MLIELVFSKGNDVRYIGHLDLMRSFQRAISRAGLPIAYSKGFNPHMILSFGLALPVGVEGTSEIARIELAKDVNVDGIMELMNKSLPKGLSVSKCYTVDKGSVHPSKLIESATYRVEFFESIACSEVESIFAQEKLIFQKKTKKKHKEVDLKEYLYDYSIGDDWIEFKVNAGEKMNIRPDNVLSVINSEVVPKRIIRLGFCYSKNDV